MKTYRLSLDDTFEDKFYVFAIYTNEEDYRMAFILNQNLSLKLKRSIPIIVKKDKAEFSIFEYEDNSLYRNWLLLQNQSLSEIVVNNSHDLFSHNPSLFQQNKYYLKDLKKARFILKVTTDEGNIFTENIIKELQNIPQIYATELVHLTPLKTKKLLLF